VGADDGVAELGRQAVEEALARVVGLDRGDGLVSG